VLLPETLPINVKDVLVAPLGRAVACFGPRWWTFRVYSKHPFGQRPGMLQYVASKEKTTV
jgi:hypothetical protein